MRRCREAKERRFGPAAQDLTFCTAPPGTRQDGTTAMRPRTRPSSADCRGWRQLPRNGGCSNYAALMCQCCDGRVMAIEYATFSVVRSDAPAPPLGEHAQMRCRKRDFPPRIDWRCGCSSMVELQLPKLLTWVRFPSPAPTKSVTWRSTGLHRGNAQCQVQNAPNRDPCRS
jgi:hypothetical protein